MGDVREVVCGGKRYTIKRYGDGVVGLLDEKDRLIAGWPETVPVMGMSLETRTDDDWCVAIRRKE